jgi:hypothetical protein
VSGNTPETEPESIPMDLTVSSEPGVRNNLISLWEDLPFIENYSIQNRRALSPNRINIERGKRILSIHSKGNGTGQLRVV